MKQFLIIIILIFSCNVAWGVLSGTCMYSDCEKSVVFEKFTTGTGIQLCETHYDYEEYLDNVSGEVTIGDLQQEIEALKARIAELEAHQALRKLTSVGNGVFLDISKYEWNSEKEAWVSRQYSEE